MQRFPNTFGMSTSLKTVEGFERMSKRRHYHKQPRCFRRECLTFKAKGVDVVLGLAKDKANIFGDDRQAVCKLHRKARRKVAVCGSKGIRQFRGKNDSRFDWLP
jgi:hypothetical protein